MFTPTDISKIKKQISKILKEKANVSPSRTMMLLPIRSLQGKLYEAHVLATICENLVTKEGLRLSLIGSGHLMLRQKGGAIDRKYPYFEVRNSSTLFGELFTDIYFNTLSYHYKGSPARQTNGDYHELDIALIKPGQNGYPKYSEIMLAVECKNTSLEKRIIREILGFRSELSLLCPHSPTNFSNWPTKSTPSEPNSVHMLYCPDNRIKNYISNCSFFGVLLVCHKP